MPLYKVISHDIDTQVFIWKITELESELKETVVLKEKHQARLDGMLSEQHRKGFLSVRKLLQAAGYEDEDLTYDANGKPHLSDGKHISITHSYEFSAIIISTKNVGIDLEMKREKMIKIAHKFIETEFDFLDTNHQYIEQLSVIWGAKEALYKMCNSRSLSFKQDMHIQPFSLIDDTGKALVDCKELDFASQFTFHFESFENYTLVYALEHE
ncbi:4'-phosphopantetheinyl transferase superfamily protein [Flavobacterium sp. xlx-214]|uniref:4'-phosphopantetheinyl transferase family protein n=1 Tax=unclassified Flavobacterium TaxID=196869 RepID=UPI0013D2FBB0|nr:MULTISPECIES: 4'-phosphopantetheinyl transferase superfamily protein [unclassified Flavobacterium]MBA5793000.1 4'-phosphopantetheinyl transferase superfamily protein [Flavobacterium sp. xlx-221]QMI84670.1 4'-phosphopantetheinyl transferase superfamily protein [Flavobacterium sp. xlx-214]